MLTQLKDHLIEFFHLPEVEDDTIWENDRNKFLPSIEKKSKCQLKHQIIINE